MNEELKIRVEENLKVFPNNRRNIVLIAYPEERGGELKSLFIDTAESIAKKLEKPPLGAGKIRAGGWDLETGSKAKIVEGKFRRVSGDTKVIDLYKDGMLILSASADEEFLAYGTESGLRINSIALIELIYNFLSFYREVLKDFTVKPSNVSVTFGFRGMHSDGKKTYLAKGPEIKDNRRLVSRGLEPRYEAPEDDYLEKRPITINLKTGNFENNKIGEIAYKVVEKIYLWFDVPSNHIPYVKTENSVKIIDIEQIRENSIN